MKLYVSEMFDGCPVRDFLKIGKGFSNRLFSCIKENIRLNGETVKPHTLCHVGDIIEVVFPETKSNVIPQNKPLNIIYEDEYFVVINKDAGVPCHPSIGHHTGTLANYINGYFEDKGIFTSIHIVSRLDMGTSGLVIIAKNEYIAGIFSKMIKNNEILKKYICVCEGKLPPDGVINAPIGRKDGSIIERCIREDGKNAETHFKNICSKNNCSLAQVVLKTGRTHQIRVHMAHIGHPLVGDWLYGTGEESRHLLHLEKIEFKHPVSGENMSFKAPVPREFERFM